MQANAGTDDLHVEDRGAVRILRMNRPEKLNALNTSLTSALCNALEIAATDGSVRAVILTGNGRAFCAGADTREFCALTPDNADLVEQRAELTFRLHTLLRGVAKPVISAAQGAAVGGGAGLAIGCDMMVAGDDIKFGYPELRHGLVPAIVMTSLTRQIGRKLAFELVSTGRMLDAATMAQSGMVNRVVPADRVVAAALDLAERCARSAAAPMAATKRLFHEAAELPFPEAMDAGKAVNVAMRGFRAPAGGQDER